MSIILPVCNGERFIDNTLASALAQSYRNLEVIVVDDGSRDGTRAIIETHVGRDSRVRVISQPNRGVAAARNRALEAASGEFIAPLDADDLWDPTKIERQVRRMLEAGDATGLVYCWWAWIDANGVVLDSSPRWLIEGDAAEALLQVNYTGNASVPLYRRRDLEAVGGYDVTLRDRDAEGCEDWDVALKVLERSRAAVVPGPLVGYRRHPDGMSARTSRMWRSSALVIDGARRRRPELHRWVIRRSRNQFALYLAGVSFWSGAYGQAVGWGLRALPSSLALQVLPQVVRVVSRKLRRRRESRFRPGIQFGSSRDMPQPLIPYDAIYNRRLKRLGSE